MTIKPPISSAASEKFETLAERMVGRAYLLWLLGVGIVLIVSRTVPALLGYVGVLLPLLFLETRFLR